MKKYVLIFLSLLSVSAVTYGQEENVGQKLEELTYKWDDQANNLESYQGLTQFCNKKEYRDEIIETLKGIHHYDSVLYQTIAKRARFGGDAEMKKTLKDIEKLESDYSINDFLSFLNEECKARYEIEKNARKTGDDADSEIYMLEVELQKYVKHITKRIDVVRDHIHHLNIK